MLTYEILPQPRRQIRANNLGRKQIETVCVVKPPERIMQGNVGTRHRQSDGQIWNRLGKLHRYGQFNGLLFGKHF